jgi:hypothetical protein
MAASGRDAERPSLPNDSSFDASEEPYPAEAHRFHREERRKTCRFLPTGSGLAQSIAEIRTEHLRGWER